MRLPQLGAKYQTNIIQMKNAEASTSMPNGTPVALVFNGTDDGLACVLPATATQAKATSLGYGVVENPSGSIAAGSIGDVIAYGYCTNAKILLVTRSATTAVWPSYPALTIGNPLSVETVNNCFVTAGTLGAGTIWTGAATTDTRAVDFSIFGPMAVLAQTLVSATTQATTTANANTASTAAVKVFLRMM